MKFGLLTAILEGTTFEEAVDFAAENQLECLEVACWPNTGGAKRRYAGVCHIDAEALTEEKAKDIIQYCKERNVEISSLGYYPNTLDPDLEKRKQYIDHIYALIDASSMLNVNMVTTFLGRVPDKNVEENLEIVKEVWPPILEYAKEQNVSADEVADFQALPGNGLTARLDGKALCGGNDTFIGTTAPVSAEMKAQAAALAEAGKTPLWFSYDGRLLGVVAVADVIKEDSPQAVRELQNMGIRVVMITGDNERTAKAIGAQAGVDQVIAGVLPDGKEREIRKLKTEGKVAMVGDGINDAPALTRADIGVAIGAGTDVAIDAADVVLMKSRLSDVPAAIRLSRATLRNIHENLFWAFFYNTIGIPLAAGVFIPLGLTLNPLFGAAAMSLSSFCVVSNALRLNLFKLRDARHDHKHVKHSKKHEEKEKNEMEKTLKITGMMCGHCEARVKKALEAVEGVAEAKVSHESGTAVVTLNVPVEDAVLKKAVEDQDYKVTAID